MKVDLQPGRYVAAISGGVDSMVLLDLLCGLPDVEIVVAHFDHGIREDSAEDRRLVQKTAAKYRLPFTYGTAKLGKDASEAAARKARYDFLHRAVKEYGAKAIITAHHEDDALETAAINLLRGTNRRGLTALRSNEQVIRPLLRYSKNQLMAYAKTHKLKWHEDSTNESDAYLRNAIRKRFARTLTGERRAQFVDMLKRANHLNAKIEVLLLAELARMTDVHGIRREEFNRLNHTLAREIMALWLRRAGLREYDKKTLERLVVAAKVARAGNRFDVQKGTSMHVTKLHLALETIKR
jgi:tRNA(Ile)-lysidine synthase